MTKQETNMKFCLLSILGIFFVVDGHLDYSLLDVGNLFPYYSFHMPLFVFISGYFFRLRDGEGLWDYGKRKFMRLMVPYYIWNLFYGLLASFLRGYGFVFGQAVTLKTLFIEPFRMGYQFTLNHAAWFVPALFLVELVYAAAVRLAGRRSGKVLFLGFLSGGIGAVALAKHAGTEGFLLTAEKLFFLLPFYAGGVLYRDKLEEKDRLGSGWYFAVVMGAAFLLSLSGKRLIYSVSTCQDFTGYLLPYITGFLGIAFWIRVSEILAPAFQNNRFAEYFGRNTFSIMMHHIMIFLVIKTGFALAAKYAGMFPDFSFEQYKQNIYYCYMPGALQWKLVYLAAGLLAPLGLKRMMEAGGAICGRIRKNI
ncbi:MAG: acyltransferase family protein [Eubacteriales bacterium]|nr:acyltransferase family protein [Eubacteriales bacterium]